MSHEGKVAIVTGAAMGIGREIAVKLSREGAYTVLFDLSEKVFETAKELKAQGLRAMAVRGDVSNKHDVEKAVNMVVGELGRIDILVNNAGIYPFKPFLEMTEDEWDKVMNVNVKGVFYFTRTVAPIMVRNNYGRIVNVSSIAGTVVGFPGLTHYCASKAAILGFTRALALELARFNITVNAVAPGPVETPGTLKGLTGEVLESFKRSIPVGRLGIPADIAEAVAFLTTERAGFITGQLIIVDGGYTIQ
ncbi:MAG: SDR family NAD(P)-dependent oxidoreductase [Thermosphaera sp.]